MASASHFKKLGVWISSTGPIGLSKKQLAGQGDIPKMEGGCSGMCLKNSKGRGVRAGVPKPAAG